MQKGILEVIHSDGSNVCLCFEILCRVYWWLNRKISVFFFKERNNDTKLFCEFKALVENQKWKTIKILRTENTLIKNYRSVSEYDIKD